MRQKIFYKIPGRIIIKMEKGTRIEEIKNIPVRDNPDLDPGL